MEDSIRLRIVVQPDDVQVKRVGRASCIEPEIKVCIESDNSENTIITLNAYLKVLGKDNKHKMILLRKSDEIAVSSRTHRREIIPLKLRFLKTMKVQVLKRNLGVARPEASIVFEAVNTLNQVVAAASTSHFAIISDPRYLDEVKKRRATEVLQRHDLEDDDKRSALYPDRDIDSADYDTSSLARGLPKRRRVTQHVHADPMMYGPELVEYQPHDHLGFDSPHDIHVTSNGSILGRIPFASTSPSMSLPPLKSTESESENEIYTDSDEEEIELIQLVQNLKRRGCDFSRVPVAKEETTSS